LVLLLLLGFAFLLFTPATGGRGRGWRDEGPSCPNNLHRVALALALYHGEHGCFPPAFVADQNGRPMHSWRVLILPYLSEQALHARYKFDEPWDGPNNRQLADEMPAVYACPNATPDTSTTNYVAVVGPQTVWPGSESRSREDATDGPEWTVLLAETANANVHWMEPRDLTFDEACRPINSATGASMSGLHASEDHHFWHGEQGVYVALANGWLRFLPQGTPPHRLEALLTADGADTAEFTEPKGWGLKWGNCVGSLVLVTSLLAFFCCVLYSATRHHDFPEE